MYAACLSFDIESDQTSVEVVGALDVGAADALADAVGAVVSWFSAAPPPHAARRTNVRANLIRASNHKFVEIARPR
jgi:hypothetical protein